MLDLCPPIAALLPQTAGPYIAMMLIGFVAGILGHITRIRWLVVTGVILIAFGACFFPLLVNLTTKDKPAVERTR